VKAWNDLSSNLIKKAVKKSRSWQWLFCTRKVVAAERAPEAVKKVLALVV